MSTNPSFPPGYHPMQQAEVTPAMTAWAVMILHDHTTYPMGAVAEGQFDDKMLLARVEWHPPDFQVSTVHRGVTLYEKNDASTPIVEGGVDPYPSRADVVDHPASEPMAPRPGTEAFRNYVLHRWGGTDLGIWASAAHHAANPKSEHEVGQAWDWGNPNEDVVNELVEWLEANGDEWARRTGLGYLIHQRQERRWYEPRGWSTYNGADPHTTHVHFSFSRAGAMGQTSAYGGGALNA